MHMTSKERVLSRERDRGRPEGKLRGKADAQDLAQRAPGMEATAIIAEEEKVPLFVWGTDYSGCAAGTPIAEIVDGEKQIFTMLVPVNTANYPGITPNSERSLFSLCHTKDPARAKPWVAPQGISGLYKPEECCTYPVGDGTVHVFRNLLNDNQYPPLTLNVEHYWSDLGEVGSHG